MGLHDTSKVVKYETPSTYRAMSYAVRRLPKGRWLKIEVWREGMARLLGDCGGPTGQAE